MTKYTFDTDENVIDDLEHPRTLAFLFNVVISKMEEQDIKKGQFEIVENLYDIEDRSTPDNKVFRIKLASSGP